MRAHDKYFILTCTIVYWPLIFIVGAPLYALALTSVMALSFGLSQKRDDKTIELRTFASRPLSEWPNMSLKRFKWLLYIAEIDIWEEDVRDYCERQPNRKDFLRVYFDRRFPLFATKLDLCGNPNESITPFKTREKARLKDLQPMPSEWYEMNEPELIVPEEPEGLDMWQLIRESSNEMARLDWSCGNPKARIMLVNSVRAIEGLPKIEEPEFIIPEVSSTELKNNYI